MGAGLALKGFRQQVHKRRGQQSACSHAEHVLRIPGQHPKTQSRSQPYAANASAQGTQKNCQENHQKPFLMRFVPVGTHANFRQQRHLQ